MSLSLTLCLFFGVPVLSLDLPPIYEKILDELSWTLKLKLLKDFTTATSTTAKTTATTKSARRVGLEALVMAEPELSGNLIQDNRKPHEKSIYINDALAEKDPSEYLKGDSRFNNMKEFILNAAKSPENDSKNIVISEEPDSRRYDRNNYKKAHSIKSRNDPKFILRNGFHDGKYVIDNSSKMVRRQVGNLPSAAATTDDENNMRMKLFRLMYETVRDSDLKVKRAELIKTHYHNSSAFDIGYLIGDITDKYNIMNDIASTLERLYHAWKPLEHINAYEQIANQAIQISHLIDMVGNAPIILLILWAYMGGGDHLPSDDPLARLPIYAIKKASVFAKMRLRRTQSLVWVDTNTSASNWKSLTLKRALASEP